MPPDGRRTRRRAALAAAAVAADGGTLLPVWEVWHVGRREASAEAGPLWRVALTTARPDPPDVRVRGGYATGAAVTAGFAALGGLLGWAAGWVYTRQRGGRVAGE